MHAILICRPRQQAESSACSAQKCRAILGMGLLRTAATNRALLSRARYSVLVGLVTCLPAFKKNQPLSAGMMACRAASLVLDAALAVRAF